MNLRVKFIESNATFNPRFGEKIEIVGECNHTAYTGDYAVTPKIESQTLPTREKVMVDDLTIKEIPFFNVSNTSGGSTVYIGKEVL